MVISQRLYYDSFCLSFLLVYSIISYPTIYRKDRKNEVLVCGYWTSLTAIVPKAKNKDLLRPFLVPNDYAVSKPFGIISSTAVQRPFLRQGDKQECLLMATFQLPGY